MIFGEKNVIEPKMCFDFLYNFVCNTYHSKKEWARYDQICTLVLMQNARHYFQILIFLTGFRKIHQYQISWKSVKQEPSFFYADRRRDGQGDITKLIVAFRHFANAAKNAYSNKV